MKRTQPDPGRTSVLRLLDLEEQNMDGRKTFIFKYFYIYLKNVDVSCVTLCRRL